ncbi:MAG: PepSY-associated TM helix domain-containing protein [Pseudohongiella sp.]|uniref:PepSY-associated TM helix domain-containing protein n=1 Tax=Pseudohongiella sp. TaxID=1979412 RepID=UPI00349FDAFF
MQRDTTRKYYALYSWVGAVTAILLFIIAFTGAMSVFGRGELQVWSNESIRGLDNIDLPAIELLLKEHAAQVDPAYHDHVQVIFPGPHAGNTLAMIFEKEVEAPQGGHIHEAIWLGFDPETLELIERHEGEINELFLNRPSNMSDFLITFHGDLHLGSPLGLILTGLLGLTLFASVITGVVIHPKILKELFSLRPWRSLRLLFTDTHKVLGVWGLLFHGTIGFTGAYLGLTAAVLIPAGAFVSFGGDQEKLIATFLPEIEPVMTGAPAEMHLTRPLLDLQAEHDSVIVGSAIYHGWGDEGAVVAFSALGGSSLSGETHEYSAATGEPIQHYSGFGRLQGVTKYLLDAMVPLHYGNFGGFWVKLTWFVLGLGTALVSVSGMMIWLERRAYSSEGSLSAAQYHWIGKFTAGCCTGVVVATLSLFHAQLLLSVPAAQMGQALGTVFFGTWALATCWALLRPNAYLGTRELLFIGGLIAMTVAPVNGLMTGDWFISTLRQGHWITAGVDLALLASGILMILAARAIPGQRPLRERSSRAEQVVRNEALNSDYTEGATP